MEALVKRWQRKGPATEAIATAYTILLESGDYGRVIVNRLTITNAGTAHTLSVMQVLGKAATFVAAAAAQAEFYMSDAFSVALGIATGDWVGVHLFDGSIQVGTVTKGASAGGKTLFTLDANFTKAVNLNAKILYFGLPASHEQVTVPINATTTYESDYGYFGANEIGDPVLLHVNNIVAASTIKAVVCPIIAV